MTSFSSSRVFSGMQRLKSRHSGFANCSTSIAALTLVILLMASPEWAQSQNVQAIGRIGGYSMDVVIGDGHAYFSEGNRLSILDTANPSYPKIVGNLSLPNFIQALAVSGSLVFVGSDTAGLQIVDASDPSSPVLRGTCDTPGEAYGVAVSGDRAYVADHGSGCLQILDISNP